MTTSFEVPTSATGGTAAGGSAASPFGVLTVGVLDRPRPYAFTWRDALWTARFIVGEAGGRSDAENRAVIWAMFNRYALFTYKIFPTFADFLRRYSTTLQPVLQSPGAARRHMHSAAFVRTGGTYPGTSIPRGQLRRHLDLQRTPWSRLPAAARQLAYDALRGLVPNPIGVASEFASTRIYFHDRHGRWPNADEWTQFTREYAASRKRQGKIPWTWIGPVPGLDQMRNAFFVDGRAAKLAPDAVRVVSPAGITSPQQEWTQEGEGDWEGEWGWQRGGRRSPVVRAGRQPMRQPPIRQPMRQPPMRPQVRQPMRDAAGRFAPTRRPVRPARSMARPPARPAMPPAMPPAMRPANRAMRPANGAMPRRWIDPRRLGPAFMRGLAGRRHRRIRTRWFDGWVAMLGGVPLFYRRGGRSGRLVFVEAYGHAPARPGFVPSSDTWADPSPAPFAHGGQTAEPMLPDAAWGDAGPVDTGSAGGYGADAVAPAGDDGGADAAGGADASTADAAPADATGVATSDTAVGQVGADAGSGDDGGATATAQPAGDDGGGTTAGTEQEMVVRQYQAKIEWSDPQPLSATLKNGNGGIYIVEKNGTPIYVGEAASIRQRWRVRHEVLRQLAVDQSPYRVRFGRITWASGPWTGPAGSRMREAIEHTIIRMLHRAGSGAALTNGTATRPFMVGPTGIALAHGGVRPRYLTGVSAPVAGQSYEAPMWT